MARRGRNLTHAELGEWRALQGVAGPAVEAAGEPVRVPLEEVDPSDPRVARSARALVRKLHASDWRWRVRVGGGHTALAGALKVPTSWQFVAVWEPKGDGTRWVGGFAGGKWRGKLSDLVEAVLWEQEALDPETFPRAMAAIRNAGLGVDMMWVDGANGATGLAPMPGDDEALAAHLARNHGLVLPGGALEASSWWQAHESTHRNGGGIAGRPVHFHS